MDQESTVHEVDPRGVLAAIKQANQAVENCEKQTVGFVDPNADRVAHVNNLGGQRFGVSPKDRLALNAIVLAVLKRVA